MRRLVVAAAAMLPLVLLAACAGNTRATHRSPTTRLPKTTTPSVGPPTGGPVPSGFLAASVTFTSDSQGWVLGTAPCPMAPCTSVLRTSDGGANWSAIPAPKVPLIGGASQVRELRFADPLDGFAYQLELWTTHDGGARWQHPSSVAGISPYQVNDLVTTSSGVYALVTGKIGAGTDAHVRLVHGNGRQDSFNVVYDFGYFGPNCVSNCNGPEHLAVGEQSIYVVVNESVVQIAGTTITSASLPDPTCEGGALAASGVQNLLLLCRQEPLAAARLYGSTNAGVSWVRLPDVPQTIGYDGCCELADAGEGHAVITLGSDRGPPGRALLVTTNYARSWSTVLQSDAGSLFGDLGFVDATDGVVIQDPGAAAFAQCSGCGPVPPGSGVLDRTNDGGAHWSAVSF